MYYILFSALNFAVLRVFSCDLKYFMQLYFGCIFSDPLSALTMHASESLFQPQAPHCFYLMCFYIALSSEINEFNSIQFLFPPPMLASR